MKATVLSGIENMKDVSPIWRKANLISLGRVDMKDEMRADRCGNLMRLGDYMRSSSPHSWVLAYIVPPHEGGLAIWTNLEALSIESMGVDDEHV